MPADAVRETNIGPDEARRRLTTGALALAIAAAIIAVQVVFGGSKWWRLLTVLPFFAGMLGLLQAKTKT